MPDKAWKAFERTIAKKFGGKRRGAHTGYKGNPRNDIIVDGYSIECKLLSRPTFQQMMDACVQAEDSRDDIFDIPLAIVKKKGDRVKNSLVIMRMEQFERFFVSRPNG